MPAKDKRYKVTADDVKTMQGLSESGMSQTAIWRLFVEKGISISLGTVHYWVNEESRKKQRKKNARRKYVPGTLENSLRVERDQQKRKENWKADPGMRLRHTLQSAKDEARVPRRSVKGMKMSEAEKLLASGKLQRRNAKIPEEE